jgi:GNAT superfamily N-acetyltransferase
LEGDDFGSFQCGEESLDTWITLRAIKNETGRASRTYVTIDVDQGVVAGYYCLTSSSLRSEDSPGRLKRNMPNPIPIILLGRLAVDKHYAGKGVGASLLQHALLKSVEASRILAAKALIVHALNSDAERFYAKFGFTLMPESVRTMYMLLDDIEKTISR